MKIINLNPETIVLYAEDGETILNIIQPSNQKLTFYDFYEPAGNLEGIPVVRHINSIEFLPPKLPNTIYLVSEEVLQKIPSKRTDFYTVADCVKNNNRAIGYKSLCKLGNP